MNFSRITETLLRVLAFSGFALAAVPRAWRPIQAGFAWLVFATLVFLVVVGELIFRDQPRA